MNFKYLVVFTRSHEHFGFVSFDNEDRSKYVALPFNFFFTLKILGIRYRVETII